MRVIYRELTDFVDHLIMSFPIFASSGHFPIPVFFPQGVHVFLVGKRSPELRILRFITVPHNVTGDIRVWCIVSEHVLHIIWTML